MASSSHDKESKILDEEKTLDPDQNPTCDGSDGAALTVAEEETLDSEKNPNSDENGESELAVEKETPGDISKLTAAEADELFEKGSQAIEDGDFNEAVDCLSQVLEFRVSQHGELAKECSSAYYKYGCALFYKAQEESDPLGTVPAKQTGTDKSKSALKSAATGTSNGEGSSNKNQNEETGEETEETGEEENEEDESDLELSLKLLDIARAIVEKSQEDTLEKVKIFSALGEVFLEREDLEASLNDYKKALSISERLFEPDHRRNVDLNFRICLVLETGSKIIEAIPYCTKAISLCKSRIEKLKENNEQEEIELFSGILSELEKKLEDLEQSKDNPPSVISQVLDIIRPSSTQPNPNFKLPESVTPTESVTTESVAAESVFMRTESTNSSQMGTIISNNGFDSPSVSTATGDSTGSTVTHLGVVGRGVKRAVVRPVGSDENLSKKQAAFDSSEEKKE